MANKFTFGSVCSGIEAASVAWDGLGKALWVAEIEPFPSAVLAHHYPSVPNLGDMTTIAGRIRDGSVPAPDVLVGGCPCQAFSIAGLRRGLDDARGQLTLSYVELANEIDTARAKLGKPPVIIIYENVPGIFSSSDNAFGCFLAGLVGESCELQPSGEKWTDAGCVFGPQRAAAWRVLDAQYFNLAQRRRRVFLVASAREKFNPSEVLFEFGGVRRDIAPSREKGENLTAHAGGCAPVGGYRMTAFGEYADDDTASTMKARDYKDATDLAVIAFHPTQDPISSIDMTHALSCGSPSGKATVAIAYGVPGNWIGRAPENGGNSTEPPFNLSPCLTATDRHGVAYSFDSLASNSMKSKNPLSGCREVDLSKTLDTSIPEPSKNQGGICVLSVSSKQQALTVDDDIANTLGASDYKEPQAVMATGLAVRRLTVTECERLQGFPDGYTAIPWRKKDASLCPDGPRYRALGNSMAVPVMRWIGLRLF